jgi:hypothetical protein
VQQRRRERVQVAGGAGLAHVLLEGHVAEGADHRRAALLGRAEHRAHGPEVDQRRRAVGPEDHVRRLDVAVQHRRHAGVQVLEDVEQAERQPQQRGRVEAGALLDPLLERRARDVLHHEVRDHHAVRGLPLVIEDLRDPVVPQRAQRRGLALEQLERLPAVLALGVQLLERDLAVARGGVDRQVRVPEGPAPERLHHPIAPRDQVLWRERPRGA